MKRRLISILLTLIIAVFVIKTPSEAQTTNGPILIVYKSSVDGKFGKYLGELLHAEGLNEFDMVEISGINGSLLSQYQVVILGKGSLTSGQASNLSTYVNNGGRLIAMQPDTQINGLFGLITVSGQQVNGYLKIENSAVINGQTPGFGLTDQTLQNHGQADRYSTAVGAVELAELYSDAVTPTGYPAVVGKASGSGWAVAYTYDLPQNIIYTRQGNHANADADIDGDGIIRTIDLFQGSPTWLDLDKASIPQADEQQRFLGRIIKALSSSPLPQLWYFPGTTKTMLVITSDAHAEPTSYYNPLMMSLSTYEAHDTIYLSQASEPTLADLEGLIAAGHSFGIHPYPESVDPPIANLTDGYIVFDDWFQFMYGIPKSPTVRHHTIAWQGWTEAVGIERDFGIRMDTDFYHWGPWLEKSDGSWAHGYITGSGLPMKFSALDGSIFPVYQQLTQLVDEQLIVGIYPPGFVEGLPGEDAFLVSKELIDASQAGYYSALMTQFHVEYYTFGDVQVWGDSTMAYAQSLGIPRWNADEWLAFTEMRDATDYQNLAWNSAAGELTFDLTGPISGSPLTTLIPIAHNSDNLKAILVDGVNTTYQQIDVNGVQMAFVTIQPGTHTYSVRYHADADLSISMTDAPDPVTAGEQITYTIIVSNAGPDDAPNVIVSDPLPVGTSFASATNPYGTCTGTTTVSCNLGEIQLAGSKTITLVLDVDPTQRTAITNTVTVSGVIDPDPGDNQASTTTGVNAKADMEVTIGDSPDPVTAGSNLVYTLTAKNNGPSTATGVSLLLTLDPGVSYLSYAGPNWVCSELPVEKVTCTRGGSLDVLAEDLVSVTVKVAANRISGLTSAVNVNAAENDIDTTNDDAIAVTDVERKADMALTISANPDPVTAGTNLVYTLTAKNNGPSTATAVTLVLALDAGVSYQTFTGPDWSCVEEPAMVTCTRGGSLDVLAEDTVNITVNVDPAQMIGLSSSASVSANELDTAIGNNQLSVNSEVERQADVSISISDSPDPVAASQDLTYSLTVQNAGPSTAEITSITDILPPGVVYQSYSSTDWTCVENAGSVELRSSGSCPRLPWDDPDCGEDTE